MRYQSMDKLLSAYWYSFSDEPIPTRVEFAPRLCDPSYLLPEESPDGLWHLFAHTWIGLEHFTSTSGLEWKRQHLLFLRGHYPFIFKQGNSYYLLFEIHDKVFFGKEKHNSKDSRIMMCTSSDLSLWSEPRMVLDSAGIARAKSESGNMRLSRPELVEVDGHFRLYFGAGESHIYDSGQKVTKRLMYAESDFIDGPYTVFSRSIMETEPDSMWRNLAVGSVRIVPCSDGFAALECAYYYDEKKNKSSSALLLLTSQDGIEWNDIKVLQQAADKGWASRYISSADLRYKENEDSWYCYYSANCLERKLGIRFVKESLGLLLGKDD